MWIKSESNLKPDTFEKNEDGSFYIRKNITEIQRTFEESSEPITYYEYDECHFPAEDLDVFQSIFANSDDITGCQEAITELFEILSGGTE